MTLMPKDCCMNAKFKCILHWQVGVFKWLQTIDFLLIDELGINNFYYCIILGVLP